MHSLITIKLSYPSVLIYNKLISDVCIDCLIEMLNHNQTLEYLDIKKCNLSEEGKKELQRTVQSKKHFELKV